MDVKGHHQSQLPGEEGYKVGDDKIQCDETEKPDSGVAIENQRKNDQQDDPQGESNVHPKGLNLFIICAGLSLSVMCMGLDRSIITTAIPKITTEFQSLPDIGWYGSSYLLATCCFQLMFGKLYAEFEIKYTFLAALAFFEVGSIISATAANSIALIVGRAVSGIGAAGIQSGTLLILSLSVPLHDRPKFTGIIGGFSGISQVIAPFLGGIFTDKLTWRWCFWINLPLGGVTVIVVLLFLNLPTRTKTGPPKSLWEVLQKADIVGTLFLFPSLICLLLALEWGGSKYQWSDWRLILLLCIFSVTILIWAFVQWKLGDNATVPLRIVRMRSIGAALWFMFCLVGTFYLIIQFIPIWFQAVRNESAYQSGINFLPATGGMTVMAIMSGFITSAIGYYVPQMYLSTIITSIATGMIYRFSVSTDTGYWIGILVLFGIGVGVGLQQSLMVPQTVLSGPDISIGTSLLLFIQTISGTVFLSIGTNVFQNRLITELVATVPEVDWTVVVSSGANNVTASMERIYPGYVPGIIEAYNKALQAVFLIAVVMAALSILGGISMEWKNLKKDKPKEAAKTGEDLTAE